MSFAATMASAGADDRHVTLRSGVIQPGTGDSKAASGGTERWVVRFINETGWFERGRLEVAGARIEAPLPGQAYLVSVPAGSGVAVAAIPGVDWATPYLPQHKISPEIDAVKETDSGQVIVLLQLFVDADPVAVASQLSAAGLQVEGVGSGERFDRIVLLMAPAEVTAWREQLSGRDDVFWVGRRHRRTLTNDGSIWVGQSGLDAGNTTPVFNHGIYGDGQIAAVLDTGIDADMCYFRDGTLGLPPTNDGSGTTVDLAQRKVIAVDFLDPGEDPENQFHWDTQNHGTHVAGILAGDDLATPILHDAADGMAPAAKLVIQDAGYAADDCGDLPGIGCPVTDLIPVFQQAYDQGARTHNNSWGDNENAAVQNVYTDASEDVDQFMWNNPDFLVFFGAGNHALGGDGYIGSPGTAKNSISVGSTYYGEYAHSQADLSSWGPTDDGRIKPDVVFPGQSIYSAGNDGNVTTDNCGTRGMGGTSMATPGAAGMSLLVREYFDKGFYPTGAEVPADGFDASAALVKAMLINSAVSIRWDNAGNEIDIPSNPQGWGRILLDNTLYFAGESGTLYVDDHADGFTGPGDLPVVYQLVVTESSVPFKVTLAWTDYPSTPAAATHLVNDLDLRVEGASGSFFGNYFIDGVSADHGLPDRLNNLEQVLVEEPLPGIYLIEVSPHAVPSGPQPFALVVSGAGLTVTSGPHPAYLSHGIDDSGANGNGDGVLDPGETAIIPVTLRNAGDADATSVFADMHSAYPGLLKVYDGSASYPDIPVGGQQGSQSPHFEITVQPDATCGQILLATMVAGGAGFETGSAFTLDLGLRQADLPSTDTPISIPRQTPSTVNSYITVADSFPVKEVDVTVNIDLGDISLLEVLLYPPGGVAPVYLHNETGPGVDGLHTTYDDLTEPDGPGSMDDLLGIEAQGTWRLKVTHLDPGAGRGTLEDWTLHIKSDTPFGCHPVTCGEGIPSAVGQTLLLGKSGAADVQLSWTGVGAADYNVWRAADPQLRTNSHVGASGGATSLIDSGAQNLPGLHFYVVRSVNSCHWESD